MRVFIALLFSKNNKLQVFKQLKNLANNYKGNYTSYNNLHLTLYYIGEVNNILLQKVKQCIKSIKSSSFVYKTSGMDCFKIRQNNCLVHLKIKNNSNLKELHDKVIVSLKNTGIKINIQKFTPHITLGRKVEINLADLKNIKTLPIELKANRISIMESKRNNGDLVYREIDYCLLK